ncbi:MAG: response regulator [Nitrospinota bacterium]
MVEDDEAAWTAFGNAFKYFGLRKLARAESGAAARKLLENHLAQGRAVPFDLIVCDLHRTAMGGVELLRHIRGHAALRHLPVVVLAENATVETVQQLSALGISAFLLKPLAPAVLAEKVSEILLPLVAARKDQAAG